MKFLRDLRIPMDDGITLSAALWLPGAVPAGGCPVIIDMTPYRWNDWMAARDKTVYEPLALRGFACMRIDVRGCGESGGVLDDEYTERQVTDMLQAIDWCVAQEWSNGKVGVMGNSWGGFAALGALKAGHPALKAGVISCASDDGHTDDAHFESGVILSENFIWGVLMMGVAALPPDPRLSAERGEDWEKTWRMRLEALRSYPSNWVDTRGSRGYALQRHYRYIKSPLLVAGGWLDAYARGQWRMAREKNNRLFFGGHAHGFPQTVRHDLSVDFDVMVADFFAHHLLGAPDAGDDLAFIYTHVPSAEDTKAEGFWIVLQNRHQHVDFKAGAPRMVSVPQAGKDGFIRSFGKWCPGGSGGNEYATYPSSPEAERDKSWVYRFSAFEKEEIFLGAPILNVNDADCFAEGVYLARLFLCRVGSDLKRIGYAVIDGRAGSTSEIEFSPFGFQAQKGDYLEVHIMPQAWPLLWAPYPDRALPENILGGLTLQQPAQWQTTQVPRAPKVGAIAYDTAAETTSYEETNGGHALRVITRYSEDMAGHAAFGEGMEQAYAQSTAGAMRFAIHYKAGMRWLMDPSGKAEEIVVRIDMDVEAKDTDLLTAVHVVVERNGGAFFQRSFQTRHADALLPPAYKD